MKKILSIDLETYSDVDLGKCGVYAYVDSPAFEILLMAYSFDDEETKIVDLACGEHIPGEVIEALFNDGITKTAFNANFERTCLSTYFKKHLKPDSWVCTAVMASMLSLPQSLDKVGEVLSLKDRKMRAKIFRSIELLERYGNMLSEPYSNFLRMGFMNSGSYKARTSSESCISSALERKSF